MNAIIIEDEPLAVLVLEKMLRKIAPEVTVQARLDSVGESVEWLRHNRTELIFSDIHLGDGQSFEIFDQVEVKVPVIFITAYDEYAIQAFKKQGIDYILKPFEEEDIRRALDKVEAFRGQQEQTAGIPDVPGTLFSADRNEDQIRTGGRSRLFYGRWKIPDVHAFRLWELLHLAQRGRSLAAGLEDRSLS